MRELQRAALATTNKTKQQGKRRRVVYPVSLTLSDVRALDLIQKKLDCSRAEAIRESIKEYASQVAGLEVIKLRSVSKQEGRKEILDYLKKHDRAWSDQIADDLRLDIRFVTAVLNELWEQEKAVEPISSSS